MAREIVTQSKRFYCVSQSPDICKTPMGNSTPPIPYTIKGEFAEARAVSPNIKSHSDKVVLHDRSFIPTVTGDAPGTATGIKSGTVAKRVQHKDKSRTTHFNGTDAVREGDVVRMNDNNTTGPILERGGEAAKPPIAQEAAAEVAPEAAAEAPKPASLWDKASPWVHGGLGLASFVPGLSIVTGGLDAAIYAGEGNLIEAGLSAATMIPGGKLVTTAGKLVKGAAGLAKGAHVAEEAVKVVKVVDEVKDVTKVAHEVEEAAKALKLAEDEAKLAREAKELKKAEEAREAAKANGKDGGKSKKKKELKCGQHDRYGVSKKKSGDNKFDRDHIPSKAALKARALELLKVEKGPKARLSPAQANAIDNWGRTIAIPKQAHINVSPTYGQSLAAAAEDAKDLAGAAKRDVEAMLNGLDEYDDVNGNCKKAYQKSVKRVLQLKNKDFEKALINIMEKTR